MLTLPQHIELRNAMHKTIYSDQMRVGYMVELLNGLDLFAVTFDQHEKRISLKIKKTNIKKEYGSSYAHSNLFYAQVIDPIFKQVIHNYRNDLYMILKDKKEFEGFDFNYPIEDLMYICSLCTMNVLLDNIVLIQL